MIVDGEYREVKSKKSEEVRCNDRGSSCTYMMKAGLLKKRICIVSHNTVGL